jgi:hypothetical protein
MKYVIGIALIGLAVFFIVVNVKDIIVRFKDKKAKKREEQDKNSIQGSNDSKE